MSQQTLFQSKSIGYEWINYMCLLGSRAILYFWAQIIHCLPRTECVTFTMPLSIAGLGLKRWKLRAGFFLADVQKMYCEYCRVQHSPSCWVTCDCISHEQTWDTKPSKLIYRSLFQTVVLNKGCSQAFITVFSPPQNGSNETEDTWLESLWKNSILPKFLFIAKECIQALVLGNSFAHFGWVLFAQRSFYTTLA